MTSVAAIADLGRYWAFAPEEVARALQCSVAGLSSDDAARRLRAHGPNALVAHRGASHWRALLDQLRSPLLLILVFAAVASFASRAWLDGAIVLTIVTATAAIGYWREHSAQTAIDALRSRIHAVARVRRDGRPTSVKLDDVVPGDVVDLSAGNLVPADSLLIEATDFYVSQAVLTGESFPVEKTAGAVDESSRLVQRRNCVFLGTNVRSGTARCLVVRTGAATQFGALAGRLALRPPETDFERGIRRFGYLLTIAMLVMVLAVFAGHMFRGRPPVETLLFSVALAVGLSPELLPAILTVSLARGARLMATRGVLVRRLNAIENLGSMNVLCTDKTGTLTEGVVRLDGAYDPAGQPSAEVLDLAACNAALETGLGSPLDDAILGARTPDLSSVRKVRETPFDSIRKRVTVVVGRDTGVTVVTKGAFRQVLAICTHVASGRSIDAALRRQLERRHDDWSRQGLRVLAVATRQVEATGEAGPDELQMTFAGFLTFLDQPKPGVERALKDLAALGISIKLITGDDSLVARHVARRVGLPAARVLTGRDLDALHGEALWHAAETTDLFVEVDPNQKERIILSLKKMGHVVGFLGDGVNDAPAMHAADTSLSVDEAADVAREAADFVLLERGLDVIRRGVEEGRKTFANTLKYILITTSANLGNMVSMAAASLLLPFLPLLASQVLLNNFLSDIPAVGLADDAVDPELTRQPRRWDIRLIGRFMVVFGLVSAVFDFLTFGALQVIFAATPEVFRTAWFVESLLTELVIALVVRTRRPFYRSRPGHVLLATTVGLIAIAFALPFVPFADVLGFVPLSGALLATLALITLLYVAAAELAKSWFYRPATALPG